MIEKAITYKQTTTYILYTTTHMYHKLQRKLTFTIAFRADASCASLKTYPKPTAQESPAAHIEDE